MSTQWFRSLAGVVGGAVFIFAISVFVFRAFINPAEPILAGDLESIRSERNALKGLLSQYFAWSDRMEIVRSNIVVGGTLVPHLGKLSTTQTVIAAQESLGWSTCRHPSPTAVASMAKGRYRFNIYANSPSANELQVSYSLRHQKSDSDCVGAGMT